MELKTKDLAQALRVANIVIERRNTIPILSHVLIDSSAGDDAVLLRGTNLDQQLTVEVPTINGRTVRTCFSNPEALAKLILAGAAPIVTINTDDKHCSAMIRCGQMEGTMATIPADDFPAIVVSDLSAFDAEIGAAGLDMLLRVAGAMSNEETRYYLNGVYFHHVEAWTWRFVSTDGHRLYYGNVELPGAHDTAVSAPPAGVIIPSHVIHQLRTLRPHMGDAPLRLRLTIPLPSNSVETLAPDTPSGSPTIVRLNLKAHGFPVELVSKLIDGTFPDYTRVIPSERPDDNQIVVKRGDLARALAGITAGIGERSRAAKLAFSKNSLTVSARWVDAGFDGKIVIPASSMKGRADFEIGYNGNYLMSLINAVRGEDLAITAADAGAPGTLIDPAATDFFAVLMPMRF